MSTQQPPDLRIVQARVTMEHIADDGMPTRSLGVMLSYDPADPFAVTAALHDERSQVGWTFARELLVEGAFEPAGAGDVLVWPSLNEAGHAVVVITLSSPSGEFTGEIPTKDVFPFVQDMLATVPSGQESELLDVDAAIEQLLATMGDR